MVFSTGGNVEKMRITSGGNVGIGTDSPDNRLDVVASDVNITPNAESSAVFRRNGNNYLTILSNASNEGGILFGNAVDDNDGSVSYRHNTQSMQFATADVERMRINSSGTVLINATAPRQAYSTTAPTKISVQGGMSEFETTLNNKYDFQNSPISILERANIDSGSADNKYSPNLNFHWSGRVSNSLWMSANGHLNYGSYTSAGIPAADGTFKAGNLNIVSTITANIGAFTGQVTGPTPTTSTSFANKAYVDAHGGGLGPFLPLVGGTMTGTSSVLMPDNFKLKLGTGGDAIFQHNGSHLFIDNSFGSTYLRNTSTGSILLRNSTGGDIQFDNEFAGNILFNTSNIERMRITAAGNVGIGKTTSLQIHKLSILKGSSNQQLGLYYDETHVSAIGTKSNGDLQVYAWNGSSYRNILLGVDGSAAGGSVGIGTNNPLAKLDITTSGNTAIPALNAVPGASTSAIFRNSGNTVILATGVSNTNVAWLQARQTTGTGSAFNIALNPLGGNVGIGETSPTSKLSIKGADAAIDITRGTAGDSKWEFSSDSTAMYISEMSTGTRDYIMTLKETTGNVGIGTTSPNHQLQVEGGSAESIINLTTTGYANGLDIIEGTDGHAAIWLRENSYMHFATNSNERMRITADGNVGIGTTSPTFQLHVSSAENGVTAIGVGNTGSGASRVYLDASNGDFSGSDYMWIGQNNDLSGEIFLPQSAGSFNIKTQPGGTSTTQFTVTQAGNVGIGTTSPAAKLDVRGSGYFLGTAASGAPLVTIENNSGSTATSYGLLVIGGGNSSNGKTFEVRDASGNVDLIVKGNGNVGINNSIPNEKLSVRGNVELVGEGVGNCGIRYIKYNCPDDSTYNVLGLETTGLTIYNRALMPSNGAIIFQNQSNNNQYYIRNSGGTNATFQVGQGAPGSNVRLFINGSGNVGIGNTATTASVKLEVTGNTLLKNSNGVGDLYLGNYATANHFRFHTNNANTFFDMNCGDIYWRQGSSTRYTFFPSTANMTVNGTITQLSDIRNKENIVEIGDCINKVQAMRGVYYNRTDINTEVTKVGVIAQEVENVLPELIIESPENGLKSVAYSELTAVLINAIKEQQEIIEDLKTRITKLEN